MKKVLLLIVAVIGFSSCATLFTGTKDTIRFDSNPQGATVYKDGVELCKTPCSVPIKRDINETHIEYRLDGYETRIFTLDQEFNVVSVINLGNLLGWAIDIVSGSIMRYDRKAYDIEMEMDYRAMLSNPEEIHINSEEMFIDVYVSQ